VVLGDDVLPKHAELLKQNVQEMFNGEALPHHVASSNAYLGAVAIRDALDLGADIVITGRWLIRLWYLHHYCMNINGHWMIMTSWHKVHWQGM
jgi:hypothetical protein